MFKFFVVASLAVGAYAASIPTPYTPTEQELKQNSEARYEFSSNIADGISDLTHDRKEVRDGLNVKGSYSYKDGYFARTVHYEADDKGYRVVKMEAVPLTEEGPHVDLSGKASVDTAAHGRHLAYTVHSIPVEGPVARVVDQHYVQELKSLV